MIRRSPAVAAEALWAALRRSGAEGLSAADAAARCSISVPYARKTMRAWKEAGLTEYHPAETDARSDSGRYVLLAPAPRHPPIVQANGAAVPRAGAMKPAEFAAIRRRLGISLAEMARRLGRTGHQPTLTRAMRRIEQGDTLIDEALAEKVRDLMLAGPTPRASR